MATGKDEEEEEAGGGCKSRVVRWALAYLLVGLFARMHARPLSPPGSPGDNMCLRHPAPIPLPPLGGLGGDVCLRHCDIGSFGVKSLLRHRSLLGAMVVAGVYVAARP